MFKKSTNVCAASDVKRSTNLDLRFLKGHRARISPYVPSELSRGLDQKALMRLIKMDKLALAVHYHSIMVQTRLVGLPYVAQRQTP